MQRTLIILKPDAIQRRLCGRIIERFESKGLVIAGMKLMRISRELAEEHYAPHKGKPFYPPLLEYITSGPVVVLVLQGPRCIATARTLMGATFGYEAIVVKGLLERHPRENQNENQSTGNRHVVGLTDNVHELPPPRHRVGGTGS